MNSWRSQTETGEITMNDTRHTPISSNAMPPVGDEAAPVPNTSMLPGTEKAPTHAELDALNQTHQEGTHDLADRMCAIRDQWLANTRSHVRYSPLTSLAAAAVLGAVIARVMRR